MYPEIYECCCTDFATFRCHCHFAPALLLFDQCSLLCFWHHLPHAVSDKGRRRWARWDEEAVSQSQVGHASASRAIGHCDARPVTGADRSRRRKETSGSPPIVVDQSPRTPVPAPTAEVGPAPGGGGSGVSRTRWPTRSATTTTSTMFSVALKRRRRSYHDRRVIKVFRPLQTRPVLFNPGIRGTQGCRER